MLLDRGRRQRAVTPETEHRLRAPPAQEETIRADVEVTTTFAGTMALTEEELFAEEETDHGTTVVAFGEDSPTVGKIAGTRRAGNFTRSQGPRASPIAVTRQPR